MQYTQEERSMLESVNRIGIDMSPANIDFIFILLLPYMDHLMTFLKRLNSNEIQMVFMKYNGVMKIMKMVEESAQEMEKELGSK